MSEQTQSTALTPLQQSTFKEVDALGKIFHMETPGSVLADVLASTAFKGEARPTLEQLTALVVVARQYKLNPFTKEIYAYPDKHKGIVPIVGLDGWVRIINEHPQFNGMEFRQSETTAQMDSNAKTAPEWMECIMYRKDRERPIVIREYLDEVYVGPKNGRNGPWQTHTKRMLRHKTMIQTARVAFGFAGIYDQDEGERILEGEAVELERTPVKTISRPEPLRPAGPDDSDGPDNGEPKQQQGASVEEVARAEVVEDAEFEAVDEGVQQETGGPAPTGPIEDERTGQEKEGHLMGQPSGADLFQQEELAGDDWQPKPGEASQGTIDFIRRRGEAKGYDAIEICRQFELNALRGISETKAAEILQWLKGVKPRQADKA